MKYVLFFLVTLKGTPASASMLGDFFKTFCDKYLIADNPYEYEEMDTALVIAEYLRYAARYNWAKHPGDAVRLRIIGNDLRQRILLNTAGEHEPEINRVIADYGRFENPHGL